MIDQAITNTMWLSGIITVLWIVIPIIFCVGICLGALGGYIKNRKILEQCQKCYVNYLAGKDMNPVYKEKECQPKNK
jgi:hypothetical protein